MREPAKHLAGSRRWIAVRISLHGHEFCLISPILRRFESFFATFWPDFRRDFQEHLLIIKAL
jgi:hypothetical protein